MTTHIDNIITSCARVLYGLGTLRSHGMPPPALHAVFQSTALAKVTSMLLQLGGDSLTPLITRSTAIAERPRDASCC